MKKGLIMIGLCLLVVVSVLYTRPQFSKEDINDEVNAGQNDGTGDTNANEIYQPSEVSCTFYVLIRDENSGSRCYMPTPGTRITCKSGWYICSASGCLPSGGGSWD